MKLVTCKKCGTKNNTSDNHGMSEKQHRTISEILDSCRREGWTFPIQAWVMQSGDQVKVIMADGRTAQATLKDDQIELNEHP